jgi:hypothetical protein
LAERKLAAVRGFFLRLMRLVYVLSSCGWQCCNLYACASMLANAAQQRIRWSLFGQSCTLFTMRWRKLVRL